MQESVGGEFALCSLSERGMLIILNIGVAVEKIGYRHFDTVCTILSSLMPRLIYT